MTSTPREVFERLLRGIAERRWSGLLDLYATDARVELPFSTEPTRLAGREAIGAHFAAASRAPLELTVRDVVVHETADPEVVVGEWTYEGRVTTTGRAFRMSNVQVMRVRDGRIVTSRDYHDHQALRAALSP